MSESQVVDPYAVVLADLRAQRDQIDKAIQAIEALKGIKPSTGEAAPVLPPAGSGVDDPGAFLGMSIVDAAKKLLAAKRKPLRNPDIWAALKAGGLHLNSNDPVNTIGAVLTRRANDVADIVKVERGTFGLKEWYPNRSFKKGKAADSEKPDENDLSDILG